MTKPAASTAPDRDPTGIELARRWNVSDRTIKTYKARGAPLHDDAAMLVWAAGLHDLPKGIQHRLNELRRGRPAPAGSAQPRAGSPAAAEHQADPDWQEFQRQQENAAKGGTHRSDSAHLAELKRQRDFALFKLKQAQARNDANGVAEASQLMKLISPIVHDEELRSLKLNRELGETVPVSEQDRTARALVYWLMRGADSFTALAAKRIADSLHGGVSLSPEEIRRIIEPLAVAKRVLEPFARAAQSPTGVALSPRIVASMRAAADDFLERGADAFDGIYGAGAASKADA